MRKKCGQHILKLILFCFAIILLGIVITGIVSYNKVIYYFNPIILSLGIIIYIGLVVLFYKKVLPKLEKIKYIEWMLFLIFTILAIASGLYFKVRPSWDMGIVFSFAQQWAKTGIFPKIWYLARFPNNTMLGVIESGILILSKNIGYENYLNTITIAGALSISIAVVISYFLAKKMSNRRNALIYLIICLFTSPLYMYCAVYYTDTFALPISVALLYIWLVIKDLKNCKFKIILSMIFGITLFIGIQLKIISAFVFIAIVVYELLKGNIKELLKKLLIILLITIICVYLFNKFAVDKLAPSHQRWTNEIPIEHWIMMGMNGVGHFSFEEYAYTDSFKTYPEKQEAIREKIIERINERSVLTHLENIAKKIGFAWHDGTYWAPDKLKRLPVNKGIFHEFVLADGEYSVYYKYMPQSMHFAMLIFIVINIIRIIKEKDYESKDIICIITMFGLMVFLVIWENRSRFLLNILLLMIMAQVNGIEYLSNCITKICSKKNSQK